LVASLQIDAISHNALIPEQSLGIHDNVGNDLRDDLVDLAEFKYQDGFCAIPNRPGLGMQIDAKLVAAASQPVVDGRSPVWRIKEGSVAEW